ncbi:MAG: hypothetical protein BIFFINMI_00996 [Phycisphaerae bacterium]|nr:hypothetical protein [Phycisphaerae bacterium]
MARNTSLSRTECRRRALLAADWFCNSQVVSREPAHDANHGRAVYNHHLTSGLLCRGLSWSQGRAIMCLLGAFQVSGRQCYADAAIRAGDYLRYGLQVTDPRDPRIHGSFREEIPASRFCYPRDGIEGALGLLLLHLATGQRDYLQRAELFANWYLRVVMNRRTNWPRNAIYFDEPRRIMGKEASFQAGGAPFFWHLFQATGKKKYIARGLKPLADGLLARWFDPASGMIGSKAAPGHHTGAGGAAINDDGASIALTCMHAATGQRKSVYLDAAVANAGWIVDRCPRPLPSFAGVGMQAITLTEVSAMTGDRKYARFAAGLMADQVKLQVNAPRQPDRHGAFRGEDEPTKWYVPGSDGREFITTRCTAYSALALLRLHGVAIGPGYSARGFARFAKPIALTGPSPR